MADSDNKIARLHKTRRVKELARNRSRNSAVANFLQMEKSRLEKLRCLFLEKLPESNQISKQQNIYQRQVADRAELREKLIRKMVDENSSFQKHLRQLFDQIF